MAIKTVTTSTTDPSQNNLAEFTAEFNARKAAASKAGDNPNITQGRRATAGDDEAAAAAEAAKAATDKAAADAKAAEAPAKKPSKTDPDAIDDLHEETDGEKKKKGLDERFNKLTSARKEAERQRDEERNRANALQAQLDAAQAVKEAAEAAKPAPKAEDFKTAEEYAEALSEYKVEKKLQEKAKADAKTALEAANQRVIDDWNKRVAVARKEIEDYDAVTAESPVPVHNELRSMLLEHAVGPQILYWLAQHPERANKINAMYEAKNFRGAAISFGQLAQQIEDDLESAKTDKEEETKRTAKEKADKEAADKAAADAAKAGKTVDIPGMTPTAKPKPPEPIKRVTGTGDGASVGVEGKFDEKGNFTGTPKEWRALRKAGKIN